MSRHLSYRQRLPPSSDNPYQSTTVDYPHPHTYRSKTGKLPPDPRIAASIYRNQVYAQVDDASLTEGTYSENPYDIYQDHGYQTGNKKDSRNTDYTFSDDSGSTRLPNYDAEEAYGRRQSRNTPSDRSSRKAHFYKEDQIHSYNEHRRVYPNAEGGREILCCESGQHCYNEINVVPASLPRRPPLSRTSDRPQSSQSSSVTSSGVHGCGGRCQTFENVCYYFLQVAFTMGIIIGVPLSIAGAVLRKSAARNLQVLVYIGAMLALVSTVLLSVQCNARRNAKRRKKPQNCDNRVPIAMGPIPLDVVPYPQQQQQQQQPLIQESQRNVPTAIIPMSVPIQNPRNVQSQIIEQQGVPWWRRKDLQNR